MLNHIKSPRTQVARKKSSAQAGRRGSKTPLTTPRRAKPWRSPCRRELRRPTCSRRPAKMTDTVPYLSRISHPNHHTLESSFLAVSVPIFATKYAFFSIFRDLQDCHTFAPIETENLNKISSNCFAFLQDFLQKSLFFYDFHWFSSRFWSNFLGISQQFLENI